MHLFLITPFLVYITMKLHDVLKILVYLAISAALFYITPESMSFNTEHRCIPYLIGILFYFLNQKLKLNQTICKLLMPVMLVTFPFCIHYLCKTTYNYKALIFLPWLSVYLTICVQYGKDCLPNKFSKNFLI